MVEDWILPQNRCLEGDLHAEILLGCAIGVNTPVGLKKEGVCRGGRS